MQIIKKCEQLAQHHGSLAIESVRLGLPGYAFIDAHRAAHYANLALNNK